MNNKNTINFHSHVVVAAAAAQHVTLYCKIFLYDFRRPRAIVQRRECYDEDKFLMKKKTHTQQQNYAYLLRSTCNSGGDDGLFN